MQKSTNVVAYKYIENDLKEQICNGLIAPGERIPSMVELCQKYDASSTTVKKSLDHLKQMGYIFAKKRVGYFVSKVEKDNFKIKFNLQDNLKDTITEMKIDKVYLCKDHEGILVIERTFYSEVLPVSLEMMEIAIHADIDLKRMDANAWIKRLENILYRQDIIKKIEVLLTQNAVISERLMEPEDTLLFRLTKTFKTKNDQFIARMTVYIPNNICKITGSAI